MKNLSKLFFVPGIIHILLIMALVMASCGGGPGDPATYTVTFVGNSIIPDSSTLVLSGNTAIEPKPSTGLGYESKLDWCIDDVTFLKVFNFTTPITGDITLYAKRRPYELGEKGPGGGIIFHRDSSGFTVQGYTGTAGSFSDYTAYYLEAAPKDSGSNVRVYGGFVDGATWFPTDVIGQEPPPDYYVNLIGNGRRDTILIVQQLALTSDTSRAPQLCNDASFGGVDDWFMPSMGELNKLYKWWDTEVRPDKYNLSIDWYWSSTQTSAAAYWWCQYFDDGSLGARPEDDLGTVRAIRAF